MMQVVDIQRVYFPGDCISPEPCRGANSTVVSRSGRLRGVMASIFRRIFSKVWKHLPVVFFVVAATGLVGRLFWAALDLAGGVR